MLPLSRLREGRLLLLTAVASACGTERQSTEEAAALVAEQIRRGEAVYREQCFACHETDEGIGVSLSSRVLASYYSARSLYDYIELAMPNNDPGSLGAQAYWDIVAYLIADRDLGRLDRPLSAAGADSLRLAEPQGG